MANHTKTLLEELMDTKTDTVINPEEVIIFSDMDGVLADFVSGMTRALQAVFGPEWTHSEDEYERSSKYRSKMWKGLQEYQKKLGGELWFELKPLPDARALWKYIIRYHVEILSATGDSKYKARGQKERWFAQYFDSTTKMNFTHAAREKAQHAGPNRILIDDKEKAIKPWVAAGGVGVLHTSAANTIAQLKQLGL